MIAKIVTIFYDENGQILKQTERLPPFGNPVPIRDAAIPRDQWPMWAKALSQRATPQDKGIGDVVARTIGPEASGAFKAFYEMTFGKPCGCDGRQKLWNTKYPLNLKAT